MLKKLMLLFAVSISLVGCSGDTISNDDSHIDENYESAENEHYYEEYYEDNSEDESSEYAFVSDWQEGEMNIEGNKSYRTVNESYNFYFAEQGNWIYYIFENYIYKENSSGETILVAQFEFNPKDISVIGDWIYYFYDSCLYKIRTDGQENSLVIPDIDSYFICKDRIFYTYTEQTSADTYSSVMKSCNFDFEDIQACCYRSGLEYDDHKMKWNIVGEYDNKLFFLPTVVIDPHNPYFFSDTIPYGIHYVDLDTLEHVEYVGKEHEFFEEKVNYSYCIMSDYIVGQRLENVSTKDAIRLFNINSKESFTITPKVGEQQLQFLSTIGYDELNGRFLMSGSIGIKHEKSLWITEGIEGLENNDWTEVTSDDVTGFINTKNYIYYKTNNDAVYRINYDGENWTTVFQW